MFTKSAAQTLQNPFKWHSGEIGHNNIGIGWFMRVAHMRALCLNDDGSDAAAVEARVCDRGSRAGCQLQLQLL